MVTVAHAHCGDSLPLCHRKQDGVVMLNESRLVGITSLGPACFRLEAFKVGLFLCSPEEK